MISYDLAKKLKDAGFPENLFRLKSCPCMDMTVEKDGTWACGHSKDELVSVPTLSELIEACGEDFGSIRKIWDHYTEAFLYWFAECTNEKGICCEGSTPEEAVANLWLALSQKK